MYTRLGGSTSSALTIKFAALLFSELDALESEFAPLSYAELDAL